MNRRQAHLAEELPTFSFDSYYQNGAANLMADTLSRCPALATTKGGTTAAGSGTLVRNEQGLEVGAMQMEVKIRMQYK